jgi:shikimate dehydrogenase
MSKIIAGVIGDPIAHSRSPLIHGYWLKHHHIDAQYEKIHVVPPDLPAFFERVRRGELAGCNVTLPHKEAAVALVDHVDDRVKAGGALNTIWRENNQLHATSTDGIGFCANVLDHCPDFSFAGARLVVFGAGGSSRPIIDECLRRGAAHIILANRTLARAQDVAKLFPGKVQAVADGELNDYLKACDLLVNCTSLGMNGKGEVDVDLGQLAKHAIVADIIYVPLLTGLLQHAQAAGLRIVPGLGMLLHQAIPGFEKWFGIKPEVTKKLHDLVARDVDPEFRSVKIIGLTGSIAMGKSEVAKILQSQGLPLFDADAEVHKLYDSAKGAELLRDIAPSAILNNKVDRAILSAIVTRDPTILTKGEQRVHAHIKRIRNHFITEAGKHHDIVVVDVPLLLEKGQKKDVDFVVVVSSPTEFQHQRALQRPGMTPEKLAMILARQMPDAEKRKHADYVIENNTTLDDLKTRTLDVLGKIKHA